MRLFACAAAAAAVVVTTMTSAVFCQELPLHTSSRWILDAKNQRVKFRCVNWAGHMETNLPEGLNKQSIPFLAEWIKKQGFNCVRLTYSIDHALNPDVLVKDSFVAGARAAGIAETSMTDAYEAATEKNPFLANATTSEVFGNVIDTLWDQGIMTVLDNHVSKAGWCCNIDDGNGWWNDSKPYMASNSRYFNTTTWLEGLEKMAKWAGNHKGVVAMSLRNEMRTVPFVQDAADWSKYVTWGANKVHAANSDVLIVIGGIDGGTNLETMRFNLIKPLNTTAWEGKYVWEFHAYSFSLRFHWVVIPDGWPATCKSIQLAWGYYAGFLLEQGKLFTGPLFLSEFGVGMTGGPNEGLSDQDDGYLRCLMDYLKGNDADWAVWALQGSYYIREGVVDYNESFGVLNSDWSDWRNPKFQEKLKPILQVTQGP